MEKEKAFTLDYAKYYDFFNQGKDYHAEVVFLEDAFKKHADKPVKTILNLGCGTGMHDIELTKRGHHITGLDLSNEMIDIAKSRNIANTDFHVRDMASFNLNKKVDACISMFAAFGYLIENKQIESSLNSIKQHLNPGGLVAIEIWNGPGVINIKPTSRIKEFTRDGIDVHRQSFPKLQAFDQRVDIKFKVRLAKDGKSLESYEEMHKMRFFFPQEIKYYFDKAGFDVLEICKTFELGTSVDENEWNMFIIGKLK